MVFPALLILLLLSGVGSASGVQAAEDVHPTGAVILVVDGLGAPYVYPEYTPYAMDGSSLNRALLFNLTGAAARVLDLRVPVPETSKSHSILVTGDQNADPLALGPNIFDQARESGYLCLALLQRGDSIEILQEQDGVIYFDDNSIPGPGPTIGMRGSLPEDLQASLLLWRSRFRDYSTNYGQEAYADYDRWAIDAACDLIERTGSRPFVLFINVGGVDSAGHDLGSDGYIRTIQALDAPLGRLAEACKRQNSLFIVTADHGMAFVSEGARGGHASDRYLSRMESLRVPYVVRYPGAENLTIGGLWSEENIAPTILDMLGIKQMNVESAPRMPLLDSHNLSIAVAVSKAEFDRRENLVGNVSANSNVLPAMSMRKPIGIALILAVNMIGIAVIMMIIRKG